MDDWIKLGDDLAQDSNRLNESEQAYRKAIELELDNFDAWSNLADLLYLRMKNYEENVEKTLEREFLKCSLGRKWRKIQ